MADTKVSGLGAAAAFLATHEFPVNEAGTSKKVTGAQILANVAQGTIGYAQITANQVGIVAQVDVTGLTVTVTPAAAGRRFKITAYLQGLSSVTTDMIAVYIMEGATQLTFAGAVSGLGGATSSYIAMAVIKPTNAAHTYKVQAARSVGTGNVTIGASVTQPCFILVEDIGT